MKIRPVPTTAMSFLPFEEEATLTQFRLEDFSLHEAPPFAETWILPWETVASNRSPLLDEATALHRCEVAR